MSDRITAIIFDMDGVLIDSEPMHLEAANRILGREGHALSAKDNEPYLGWNEEAYWTDLKRRFALRDEVSRYIHDRHEVLVEMLREELPVSEGVEEVIAALRDAGLALAVASSSERDLIDHVLEGSGLGRYFEVVASGDEVKCAKPDPEIFLLAAERLGKKPEECLVFEDSVNGVNAARAAGMRCVRVITEMTRNLEFPMVDQEIMGFTNLDANELVGRIGA